MFDLDPALLFSGLVISSFGVGMFIYGRKRPEPKCIVIGLAMIVFPMFVHSLLLMWGLAAGCAAGAYALPRAD